MGSMKKFSVVCGWAMDLLWTGSDRANKLVQVGTSVDNFPRVFGTYNQSQSFLNYPQMLQCNCMNCQWLSTMVTW